jgi:hypothetical protein
MWGVLRWEPSLSRPRVVFIRTVGIVVEPAWWFSIATILVPRRVVAGSSRLLIVRIREARFTGLLRLRSAPGWRWFSRFRGPFALAFTLGAPFTQTAETTALGFGLGTGTLHVLNPAV